VNILELVLVTGVLVGVTEELLFRGMMQRWLSSLVGQPASILYVSILFGSMHSIWFNPGDVMFAFAVSLLLGWSYARTRNFWFITVVHGMINVTAFVVLPVLGG
jgi:membrane protease YdiL (CAAX protease family)